MARAQKFRPTDRLHYSQEYDAFFENSEVSKFKGLIIFRVPNEHKCARLGITVKKGATSVLRNRVKRQIREVFRKIKEDLGAFDYNVVIRAELCAQQIQELKLTWAGAHWTRSHKRSRAP